MLGGAARIAGTFFGVWLASAAVFYWLVGGQAGLVGKKGVNLPHAAILLAAPLVLAIVSAQIVGIVLAIRRGVPLVSTLFDRIGQHPLMKLQWTVQPTPPAEPGCVRPDDARRP